MPTVFRREGARFFFYSNEGDPREPPHVHVERGSGAAKIRLGPEVAIVESFGFSRREQSELLRIVEATREEIERAWHDHFG